MSANARLAEMTIIGTCFWIPGTWWLSLDMFFQPWSTLLPDVLENIFGRVSQGHKKRLLYGQADFVRVGGVCFRRTWVLVHSLVFLLCFVGSPGPLHFDTGVRIKYLILALGDLQWVGGPFCSFPPSSFWSPLGLLSLPGEWTGSRPFACPSPPTSLVTQGAGSQGEGGGGDFFPPFGWLAPKPFSRRGHSVCFLLVCFCGLLALSALVLFLVHFLVLWCFGFFVCLSCFLIATPLACLRELGSGCWPPYSLDCLALVFVPSCFVCLIIVVVFSGNARFFVFILSVCCCWCCYVE